ncbi:hypothetical protein Emag_005748 [Eimeria magna]
MRERALHPPPPAGEDSPSSSLQQAASSVVQYLHPSLATARPKAARFQGAEAQCVLIPTAAALRVAGACVKQCTLGCLSHLHKARITAARFCGHSGPLYGEKKQAVQPEEEAALRQRAASCARHCVAHCLTASSREALIRQAAQGFGAHAVHPSTDTSAVNDVNDDTFCPTGHTEDPGLETQPAEAPEMCASTSTLDAPEVSRRPSSSCNLPDAIMPKKEAAQPPGKKLLSNQHLEKELRARSKNGLTATRASPCSKKRSFEFTRVLGTRRMRRKFKARSHCITSILRCSELSKELQYVAPKAVLPRWQRQALDLASYSAYVNLEAVRKEAAAVSRT